ncbi:unnamed protein product [Didymodactylos carnosus]|uniref:Uncharacterized protein n=1 Tax=Didymodactylos carnosus TaxID=1234261 RepID=A0A815KGA8_9BILA|nr:unnamed protein product [Didymodactylos carnosus]CAF4287245.1 unnamed protein product [Didymodactylos carnosus]
MLDKRDASTNVDTPESVDPQASLYTLYTAIDLHSVRLQNDFASKLIAISKKIDQVLSSRQFTKLLYYPAGLNIPLEDDVSTQTLMPSAVCFSADCDEMMSF